MACNGVHPSLSPRLTSAPRWTRNSTMSRLSSIHAYLLQIRCKNVNVIYKRYVLSDIDNVMYIFVHNLDTWWRAVSPSTLAVSISAPLRINLSTSSRSEAAQEARKTQPSVNWILRARFEPGSVDSFDVSLSCHLFNCSALLKRADVDRVSSDILFILHETYVFWHAAVVQRKVHFT